MLSNMTLSSNRSEMGDDTVRLHKVVKLLLLSALSIVGTVGNIFAISAIMLENQLKKRGNIFIVNLAIADSIVSAVAIPASSITILAGITDNLGVCYFQWFSAMLCCHVSVLSLMFIAVENRFRIAHTTSYDRWFKKINILGMVTFVWTVSTTCVTLEFVLDLGPDYCTMDFRGVLNYHAPVWSLLVALPLLIAFACYLRALCDSPQKRDAGQGSASGSGGTTASPPAAEVKTISLVSMQEDCALLKTNFLVFFVFLLFWMPLVFTVGIGWLHGVSRHLYDKVSWLALSNSCVNSFIYGLSHKPFRSAYVNLFHYCCCKTSVSFSSRRPRADLSRPHSDVRVHIIPGYNMYTPPRQSECKRCVVSKSTKSKDVYEL